MEVSQVKSGKPKSEEDLKSLVGNAIKASSNHDQTNLSEKRTRAMEYYRGQMNDVPAMEGKSQIVSRDVAVIIGWMLPHRL